MIAEILEALHRLRRTDKTVGQHSIEARGLTGWWRSRGLVRRLIAERCWRDLRWVIAY